MDCEACGTILYPGIDFSRWHIACALEIMYDSDHPSYEAVASEHWQRAEEYEREGRGRGPATGR